LYWGEDCNKYLKFNGIVIPIAETMFIHKVIKIKRYNDRNQVLRVIMACKEKENLVFIPPKVRREV
jgi:hypothetical protein